MAKKAKPVIKLKLPECILDLHCHGRDWDQRLKTTLAQVMRETNAAGIAVTGFMPNTLPSLTDISHVEAYLHRIRQASVEVGNRRSQYVYFGATDTNFDHCERAMKLAQVLGPKIYSFRDGKSVTTGSFGVSRMSNILHHMEIAAHYKKVVPIHCDDPDIIATEGYTKQAEIEYVAKMLGLARAVKGVRIVFCHVSCRESAELILAAQRSGMEVAIELSPHYLWFDGEGTNWRPDIGPEFYDCFNRMRTKGDREFLTELAWSDNELVVFNSDSACHEKEAKKKGAGGLPTNQHLIPTLVTLGVRDGISEKRLAQLLCHNAAEFYRLPVSRHLAPRNFELRPDNTVYNNGIVENPWKGSLMYLPIRSAR